MYDILQSYVPAFFLAGALTIFALCLLFLVPFLLPPEVKDEWCERRERREEFRVSVPSAKLSKQDDELKVCEKRKDLNAFLSNNEQVNRKFATSMECILEKYLSMPKLVTGEECILGKMFSSKENIWELLGTSRETDV